MTERKEAELISAFPGTGKTYFYENRAHKIIIDSDSSKFNKDLFPLNYIRHIERNRNCVDIILISSHKEVREALVENKLFFTLVYPKLRLKEEYLNRYKERGSPEGFIKLIEANWDGWITELQQQENCHHIQLESGQFINDIF